MRLFRLSVANEESISGTAQTILGILAQMQQAGNRKLNQAVVNMSLTRVHTRENRTDSAAGGKRAAALLWWHGTGGVMAHGGTGGSGPRCDPFRQGRFADLGQSLPDRPPRGLPPWHPQIA